MIVVWSKRSGGRDEAIFADLFDCFFGEFGVEEESSRFLWFAALKSWMRLMLMLTTLMRNQKKRCEKSN